jgi:pyruvate kinase
MQAMALLQKRIIARCNRLGKPALITRLVDTMVSTPRPTRAGAHTRPRLS